MLTLYHCVGARSFRPLWVLAELGLLEQRGQNLRLVVLPFPPRAVARQYLDENPLGTVPLLIDGATRMSESAAIAQYLAEKYAPNPLRVMPDEPDYGAWLNFLHFGEATLTFPQTLVLRYGRFELGERRLPQVVEDYGKWFHARLKTLEPRLAVQDFLCADRFTVADISVGYALHLAEMLGLSERFTPAVLAYWQRLKVRPGFRRVLEAEREAAEAQGVSTIPAPLVQPG
ncbi:MAG TPA: glutathione S-transferase family protein [Rhabdaerophilum sp.]|nr:glutathione S-transferase family protein [Rhabdaerophilum sp.]